MLIVMQAEPKTKKQKEEKKEEKEDEKVLGHRQYV